MIDDIELNLRKVRAGLERRGLLPAGDEHAMRRRDLAKELRKPTAEVQGPETFWSWRWLDRLFGRD